VVWGVKGFSVGTTVESHGTRTSFAYGFPPGAGEIADTRFEVYLHRDTFANEERLRIEQRLMEVAPFRKGGQYTMRLALDAGSVVAAEAALAVLWEIAAGIQSRGNGVPAVEAT
jgi:hypothetical protein